MPDSEVHSAEVLCMLWKAPLDKHRTIGQNREASDQAPIYCLLLQEMYAFSIASSQAEGGPIVFDLRPEMMGQPPFDPFLELRVAGKSPAGPKVDPLDAGNQSCYSSLAKLGVSCRVSFSVMVGMTGHTDLPHTLDIRHGL